MCTIYAHSLVWRTISVSPLKDIPPLLPHWYFPLRRQSSGSGHKSVNVHLRRLRNNLYNTRVGITVSWQSICGECSTEFITPRDLFRWANRRAHVSWVSCSLAGANEAMQGGLRSTEFITYWCPWLRHWWSSHTGGSPNSIRQQEALTH